MLCLEGKISLKFKWFLLFFVVLTTNVSAFDYSNLKFINLNRDFRLSIRETNSVCEDLNGFIWASSKMGVIRYSIHDIKIYTLPFENLNVITTRLVFSCGKLYAYTNNGQVFIYDTIKDRFVLVLNLSAQLNAPFLYVTGLFVMDDGSLCIPTKTGLYRFSKEQQVELVLPETCVYQACWFDNNRFLLAMPNQLLLFNPIDQKTELLFQFPAGKINEVTTLYYDRNKRDLWIGTVEQGVYVLKGIQQGQRLHEDLDLVKVPQVPKQPILSFECCDDSTMFMGIDGQGIWIVDRDDYRIVSVMKEDSDNPNSLVGNGVYDMLCCASNRLWVCTYSGGLSYLEMGDSEVTWISHLANEPNSLVNNDVNAVLEDRKGNLWFATNNGVSRWNVATNQWRTFYHNNRKEAQVFLALSEDVEGNIWAGSYSSGVYVLDGDTGVEIRHIAFGESEPLFKNNFIFNIITDSQNNVWIGGVQGEVLRYEMGTKNITSYGSESVYVMKELDADHMLLGCAYGLSILDKKTAHVDIVLNGYIVHDMLVIGDVVWLATVGEGLVSFNLKTSVVSTFTTEIGLPFNFVNSMMFDNGYFWLGTENGMCRFNPADRSLVSFPAIQSLSNISFNRNAHFLRRNGEMIWGTNQGAVMFSPSALKKSNAHGRIYFQDIVILGKSLRSELFGSLDTPIDSIRSLTLDYDQNNLLVEMIPLGLVDGVNFSWKLEGFDAEWSRPVNSPTLNYTNLPAGNYRLKIRLYDTSLSEILDERMVDIVMLPPFWETWWFYLLVAIAVIGVLYFSLRYYVNFIRQLHSEEKIRFFASTAHDMRTSLSLIKGPINELGNETQLSEKGQYYIDLARNHVERLLGVVTQLMDFQKVDVSKEQLFLKSLDLVVFVSQRVSMFQSYAATHQVEIVFNSAYDILFSAVDERLMEKVLDNLLSNAIKYSKAQTIVFIHLSVSRGKWVLEVKDQGIGISKSARRHLFKEFYRGENAINSKIVGSGIGLLMVRKYVALHGGSIDWVSQENQGTAFTITIPIKGISECRADDEPQAFLLKTPQIPPLVAADEVVKDFTVMVVEDNDELRSFLQQYLSDGFNVLTASDGLSGWEVIQRELPDLIISDILMPGRDGYELCSLVKSTYETSHIPVILLTALSEQNDQLHGFELGADDYLLKPFDSTVLKQKIISVIGNRSLVRERAMKMISGVPQNEMLLSNALNDSFVKRALEVVGEQLANPEFNKDLFASAMNVSGSLLYKKIKSLTDQSPSDFIRTVRLTKALELLQKENYTITEVSELCGFSSVGYFSTVFKKYYGKTPSDLVVR